MTLKALKELYDETNDTSERRAQWILGATFTEFVRNPSALHWRALESAMKEYQHENKN